MDRPFPTTRLEPRSKKRNVRQKIAFQNAEYLEELEVYLKEIIDCQSPGSLI
jgi:hypothetical protein